MKRFIQRAAVVEAERFDGTQDTIERLRLVPSGRLGNAFVILSSGETKVVVPGDWIVLEEDGARYVLSEEDFQKRFVPYQETV